MIVSDKLTLEDVFVALAPLESYLGRQVNPTLYSRKEFFDKSKMKKGFLVKVLNAPVIELIGSIDE